MKVLPSWTYNKEKSNVMYKLVYNVEFKSENKLNDIETNDPLYEISLLEDTIEHRYNYMVTLRCIVKGVWVATIGNQIIAEITEVR